MKRIQRKRTKGWRKPPNTKIVDRTSRWGNPFKVGETFKNLKMLEDLGYDVINDYSNGMEIPDYETAGKMFKEYYEFQDWLDINELKGLDLACPCKPYNPCHADILLELAK
ncbi:DUF4326 domain-containing protein [bacterium AH-315-C07]|nr:DUF4326 domain-containing protein [bacterium AH-315-C07]